MRVEERVEERAKESAKERVKERVEARVKGTPPPHSCMTVSSATCPALAMARSGRVRPNLSNGTCALGCVRTAYRQSFTPHAFSDPSSPTPFPHSIRPTPCCPAPFFPTHFPHPHSSHVEPPISKESLVSFKKQLSILSRALALLRPGGRLVYSTCALDPLQGEAVVAAALAADASLNLLPPERALPSETAARLKWAPGLSEWLVPHPEFEETKTMYKEWEQVTPPNPPQSPPIPPPTTPNHPPTTPPPPPPTTPHPPPPTRCPKRYARSRAASRRRFLTLVGGSIERYKSRRAESMLAPSGCKRACFRPGRPQRRGRRSTTACGCCRLTALALAAFLLPPSRARRRLCSAPLGQLPRRVVVWHQAPPP